MAGTKKLRVNDPRLGDTLVNKALEKYGVTVDDIKKLPDQSINGIPWYQYYTFDSKEEYETWKEWCRVFLSTQVTPKFTKRDFEMAWSSFDLAVGLKQNYTE